MSKKSEDDYIISETGNWNVAQRFSEEKFLKPMIRCDIYEDLARYGHDSIIEELENWNQIPSDVIRVKALSRLINELIKICKNSKFALKRSGTLREIKIIEDKLYSIKKFIDKLYYIKSDNLNKTKQIIIYENKFEIVLENVLNLKSDLNNPLNQNHLIYVDKEEFDPVAFKEKIKHRMLNKG